MNAGSEVILDAEAGEFHAAPGTAELAAARARLGQARERQARALGTAAESLPAGRAASASRCSPTSPASLPTRARRWRRAPRAAACCAPSSCSWIATTAPDEDEQTALLPAAWRRLLAAAPLVIRTLDIGGDKPIAYLPLPPEDNPALGLRGVRTSLWRPRPARRAVARDPARCSLPGSCASCCRWSPTSARSRAVRRALDAGATRLAIATARRWAR